ncbi:hypothetical protein K402DRAFT_393681 [Aulographum hederae CBS 113979]|uniref:Uncharacterized protein n=1 Tax=Aulographum hederae CBS 113979 TaxID=1176131 RepID=A0A6G1H0N5_9PEZI|nr:hypothetical protein K402DRAFT_393681 [Aulographum hederae CBS 113979]
MTHDVTPQCSPSSNSSNHSTLETPTQLNSIPTRQTKHSLCFLKTHHSENLVS